VLLIGAAWGGWWALDAAPPRDHRQRLRAGAVVQITPQVGGTVLAVLADDTDFVKAGQPLVRLDPADARLALERAEAQLAQTVREVRTLYANNATLGGQHPLREAELARVQADWQRAPTTWRAAAAAGQRRGGRRGDRSTPATLAGARSTLAARSRRWRRRASRPPASAR
jgi:membrane fusion protein (multidrug efflux system)